MKSRILVLSIYPAPYRMNVFCELMNEFDVDVFFEMSQGDQRDESWFCESGAYLLDRKEGKRKYKEACQQLKKYNLIVLYDYSTYRAYKLIMLCKILHIPYVLNCDGVMLIPHSNRIKDWIKTFLVRGASAYLASGQYAKKYFIKYGAREELVHIHTFTTLQDKEILRQLPTDEEKRMLRRRLGLPEAKKIAIAVGRFIPLKRYKVLIECWKKMDKDNMLLLIGGGVEYSIYKEIIANEGLDNVILEQFYPKEKLLEYYKASDVFVHPTEYDVWGLVVNEAMASGLPVVVSDYCVAGLELVQEGINGYIVPHDEKDEFLDKVRLILADEMIRKDMANQCLNSIRSYTTENMAHSQMATIKKVLSRMHEK